MGNIVLLDELTINKIAAGEVIERPASVIKEMVENSIDAGATNITIEIKNGGISYIRITDNGKGIAQDDLEIAFERHATSKIRNADDLSTVKSMGFRGEALASIAAISKIEMVSKTETQQNGYKIVVEGGNVKEKTETGCATGTTITVTNLFYNTPVRYKFLKKDYTEAGYIEDVVTRIALIHPEISLKLINTGKTIIQTNGNGDLKTVVYSIYGKDIAGGILETKYEYEDIKVSGVIGKPEIARSNRANQMFFINSRYVKDRLLTSAAEKAYKGMLPIGKFSFLVLNIEMNPKRVDVNVHPAKLEVRFEEENTVFKAVYHAIKETLLKTELVANTEQTQSNLREEGTLFNNSILREEKKPEIRYTEEIKERKIELGEPKIGKEGKNTTTISGLIKKVQEKQAEKEKEGTNELEVDLLEEIAKANQKTINLKDEIEKALQKVPQESKEEEKEIKKEPKIESVTEQKEEQKVEEKKGEYTKEFEEMYLKLFGTKPVKGKNIIEKEEEKKEPEEEILENISIFENIPECQNPTYKFIGIAFKTYIIIEIEKEMYIIDQHAAHERILYEKVKENYYRDENKDSQLMLLPDIITLTHKEMQIAKENMQMFKKAGFMLEEFGENTIKLTGVPEMCIDLNTKDMFLETLDEINSISRTAKQEIEERFIATVACKAAVKANMVLTEEEVDSLMVQLLKLPNPFTCPHGRPTAIKMSKYDIERKFSRK